MRILIVTDAWYPQVNGVVRTIKTVCDECRRLGHVVRIVSPDGFPTFPCPTYPEIRLAIRPGKRLRRAILEFAPDAVHIATEGPLGLSARRSLLALRIPFTTSFHTRFPEYIAARMWVPKALGYGLLRWFHRPSAGLMVATRTIRWELSDLRFRNLRCWSRGVDTDLFSPAHEPALELPPPVFLYVGRVAVEKNIAAFLDLELPGSKLVVGDGPALARLKALYPDVVFAGMRQGLDLARHYTAGDVFVFPSRTDTFGLVLLEALASGLPVAAYPVSGPIDVIGDSGVGVLDEDLRTAALEALEIPPAACRAFAERHSWRTCAEQFLENLAIVPRAPPVPAA